MDNRKKNSRNAPLLPKRGFKQIDDAIVKWKRKYSITLLRLSVGLVFFWFGVLKFFPSVSPAEGIVLDTIHQITFGWLSDRQISVGLATWEALIGIGLIVGRYMRAILFLLFLQLPGTFLPVLFFPDQVFEIIPWVPTLKGQYIFKNLVIVAAGIVLGSQVEEKPLGGLRKKAP
ncbi:hypothetical protein ADIS_0047 [Lunatimonas lonarensis]|uniref:DoxX family membrane protein n=1 Tax=Lunatimonas lonarensis TaxID=1232681 RepID=R7ZZG4_9BACT|nr:DUF417 family protein [Lunatimonas lonarensis]EON79480.1 hypothetical protein ADIS_0047 [Lunatimonas lonarensis]